MTKYKILVTGGTGFIGRNLTEKLVKDGHYVRCLVRKPKKSDFLDSLGVEKIYGDIEDICSIDEALDGIDVVYHLVGIVGKRDITNDAYWNVHVNGTKNLLDSIIKRNNGIKRLVHCSTAGVLGPVAKLPADESYPYNPTNIYEETKVEAEKLVLRYYNDYKVPITIIRPELVYGPGDLHLLKLFKAIKKGVFPLIGDGNSTLLPIYIDDLIKAFTLCIENDDTIGEIYLIGGNKLTTIKELATCMANAMGIRYPKIYIPKILANALAVMAESSSKIFKFDPPITKSRVKFFTESRGSTYDKAYREFGYSPSVELDEGMKKTVEWYIKNDLL